MTEAIKQRIAVLEKKIGQDAKSPLFAQLANYYIEVNRAQDALSLCDAGLAHFPFYTTGHLVKGKALFALNMRAEARREFEFVLGFLPKNETIISLLEKIPASDEETLDIGTKEEMVIKKFEPAPSSPGTSEQVYTIPSVSQSPIYTEPEQNFEISSRITSEPVQTSVPVIEPPSAGPIFFESTTQTPVIPKSDDPFGLGLTAPAAEAPGASPFGGFNVEEPAQRLFPEDLIPTAEQQDEFIPAPSAAEIPMPVKVAEEPFDHYAARRKKDLPEENMISLEDYFNNVTTLLSQLELPSIRPGVVSAEPEMLPPPVLPKFEEPVIPKFDEPVINRYEQPFKDKFEEPVIPKFEEPVISKHEEFIIPQIDETELPRLEDVFSAPIIELPQSSPPVSAPFITFDMPTKHEAKPAGNPIIDLPQSAPPFIPPASTEGPDKIEELANKLQSAKRITPAIDITPVINIVEKETPPQSQQDSPPIGFVTPTLAEIYAKQGWYDDAIKAYRTLVRTKPGEKERFERRIAELEEQKKQGGK